jgi:hypothetical protein
VSANHALFRFFVKRPTGVKDDQYQQMLPTLTQEARVTARGDALAAILGGNHTATIAAATESLRTAGPGVWTAKAAMIALAAVAATPSGVDRSAELVALLAELRARAAADVEPCVPAANYLTRSITAVEPHLWMLAALLADGSAEAAAAATAQARHLRDRHALLPSDGAWTRPHAMWRGGALATVVWKLAKKRLGESEPWIAARVSAVSAAHDVQLAENGATMNLGELAAAALASTGEFFPFADAP